MLQIPGKGLNSLFATLENISKQFPVSKGSGHNPTAQPILSTEPSTGLLKMFVGFLTSCHTQYT